jgi:hypothetical protein
MTQPYAGGPTLGSDIVGSMRIRQMQIIFRLRMHR